MMARRAPTLREPVPLRASPAPGVAAPLTLEPRVPAWARDAVADPSLELFTAVVPQAASLGADALRRSVAGAYETLGAQVRAAGKSPIRCWNYLPDPAHVMGAGLNRYMVFNAGRYDGYRQWDAERTARGTHATASAVGVPGSDVTIHWLASADGGVPVENPRQMPAWRYSARYGPVPPCFARATVARVNGRRRLLIAGTASIVGEDSRHDRDVVAQLTETLVNLETVITSAQGSTEPQPLGRLVDARLYVVRPEDARLIESVVQRRCPNLRQLDTVSATLCRPELLIEIEGVAAI